MSGTGAKTQPLTWEDRHATSRSQNTVAKLTQRYARKVVFDLAEIFLSGFSRVGICRLGLEGCVGVPYFKQWVSHRSWGQCIKGSRALLKGTSLPLG